LNDAFRFKSSAAGPAGHPLATSGDARTSQAQG
jgi:hypothetical protein